MIDSGNLLRRPWPMIIDGKPVQALSGEEFDVFDPGTGEVIARVPRGSSEDVDRAVAAARAAFEDRRWMRIAPRQRMKILWRLAELLEQNAEELATLESRNNGVLLKHARLMINSIADAIRYNAGWIERVDGKATNLYRGDQVFPAYTRREPIGVAGLICAWNGPLSMAGEKVSAALSAGCTCVLKPAEETPLTAIRLGELCLEAGVPEGVVNVVTGFGHEAGAAISAHPGVDKISFTGSTEVGRLLIQASAATNMKKLTLELGGKSPMIVFDDADIEAAAKGSAGAIFTMTGQMCFAASRVFVHEKVIDPFVEALAEIGSRIRYGYFDDPDADIGPLISGKQRERVDGYVQGGVECGATAVIGGKRPDGPGHFYPPTVMTGVNQTMRLVREEIFGPVVSVMAFNDEAEVLRAANDTPYGLAGSVWTANAARGIRAANAIRAGRVGINNHPTRELTMPTGGFKQSGWGRECGQEGIEAFMETKSIYQM